MAQNNKILALDIGERRIGVAIASDIAKIAAPLETIDTSKNDIEDYLKKLIKKHEVSLVVIGLPRGLDGQDTLQTKYVRQIAGKLNDHLQVPIVMQDEAGTSVEAEQRLKVLDKKYTKEDIDAEAAAIILHDYLQEQYFA